MTPEKEEITSVALALLYYSGNKDLSVALVKCRCSSKIEKLSLAPAPPPSNRTNRTRVAWTLAFFAWR